MADAPSGGSKWEAFEIIVLVLLAIGLLMRLQGTSISDAPTTTQSTSAPKASVITTPGDQSACGLSLSRPHSLEKVTTFVTLIGSVNGCNWSAKDGIALYAQVVDARGLPVSPYVSVPVFESGVSFNTTITLNDTAIAGKGYIILVPATQVSDHSVTVRIPITF